MEESKQILVSLGRLEENFKNMNAKIDNLSKVSEMAVQTDQSVRSAHNRIDDLKKDFAEKLDKQEEEQNKNLAAETKAREKMESNQTWLVRVFAVAIIGWLIDFFTSLGG